MEDNFDNVMSKKTDEELIRIITIDFDKYREAAIESAKKEIRIRNIDDLRINEINRKVTLEKEVLNNLKFSHASTGKRLLNFIIDFISFAIIFRLIGEFFQIFMNINIDKDASPYVLFMLIAFLINYCFMEFKFQKTLGKFITKTKVLTTEGERPSLNDILSRTFCRLIPFDRLSFLFSKNGFHDRISNTIVVND
ncbi:MAG: RDD family protein [Flavobacterium sp.]